MKFRKIKKKPLIFLLVLCLLGIVGTTFAYYYTEIAIPNQFKAMTYNVTIEEEFNDTWGTKKVSFVNNEETNTPVVLRINYNELWRKEVNGVKLSLDNNVNGVNVVTKNWTTAFTNDFVDGGDGWYYYKKTLNAEESVQVLNSISLNESLISTSPYYNDYKTYTYELDFNFEAIQANSSAISEIWGKNAAIVCIPMIFGHHPVVVLSGSMKPTYKVGSVIYYKKVSQKELKVGDVITFNANNNKMVSHRIANIDNGFIETKGDANKVSDVNKIRYENVRGKVGKLSIPYVGYYIKTVNDNLTLVVIVTIIILVSEFLISNTEAFDINNKNGRSEKDAEN